MQYIRLAFALSMLLALPARALPQQCIVALDRQAPCPNLRYTSLHRDNGTTEVVCACIPDLKALIRPARSETEQVLQKMELQSFLSHYRLSQNEFNRLLKRD